MILHRVVCTVGVFLLYASTTLRIYVTAKNYINFNWTTAITSTFLVVFPLVIVNTVSAIILLRPQNVRSNMCTLLLHIFQLGLIDRCVRIYRSTVIDTRELFQLSILTLGYGLCGTLPLVVMDTLVMKSTGLIDFSTMAYDIMALIFVSLMLTYTEMVGLREISEVKVITYIHISMKTIGVASLTVSRSLSIVLFFSVYNYWIFVVLFTHMAVVCIIMLVKSISKGMCAAELITVTAKCTFAGYANIVDSLDINKKRPLCAYVIYYTIILLENTTLSGIWMIRTNDSSFLKLTLVMSILLSYILGLLLKYLRHCWDFEESDDLIKALEITKEYDVKQFSDGDYTYPITIKDAVAFRSPKGKPRNPKRDRESEITASYNNAAFESTETEFDPNANQKHDIIQRKSKRSPKKERTNKPKLFSAETTSNTSRNTNTLNISGQDDQFRCKTCSKFIPGDHPIVSRSPSNTPFTTDKVCLNENVCSNYRARMKTLDLRYSGGTSFESDTIEDSSLIIDEVMNRHQRSNIDRYTTDTVSNFSLYYNSTLTDSDSASTWPHVVERCHLPTEKLSPEERISAWFTKSTPFLIEEASDNSRTYNTHDVTSDNQSIEYGLECNIPREYDILKSMNRPSSKINRSKSCINTKHKHCISDTNCFANEVMPSSSSTSSISSGKQSSRQKRHNHRKIPYRDALEEYYRKSRISYNMSSISNFNSDKPAGQQYLNSSPQQIESMV